jgi:hypothetical protein
MFEVLQVMGALVIISAFAAVTIVLLRAWRIASELNRFFSPSKTANNSVNEERQLPTRDQGERWEDPERPDGSARR